MSELQELVDEALADWYTECHKFDTEEEDASEELYTAALSAKYQSTDWTQTGLDPRLLRGVTCELGITRMTPVQKLTIPGILSGQNLIATAETGSGKTLAFVLPICHLILRDLEAGASMSYHRAWNAPGLAPPLKPTSIRCLALSPTREIAIQTQKVIETVTEGLPISSAVICGGLKHNAQEQCLRRGVNFVCACPGRLLDVLSHEGFVAKFKSLRYVVLDEADRMLGLGFADDVEFILKSLQPFVHQILLFSASLPAHVHTLARTYMSQPPIRIGVLDGGGICRCEKIKEIVIKVPPLLKLDLLRYLLLSCTDIVCTGSNSDLVICKEPQIDQVRGGQCIIFTRTKARANRVCERLRLSGFLVERIHGNRSQTARVKALEQFVLGECKILVATDVAARGIDLYEVPLVINFDLPNTGEEYTHRAGRTGRAGKEGQCWSLLSDIQELEVIEQGLGRALSKNLLSELVGFNYKGRRPTFAITESGHQNEIFPSPVKTAPRPKCSTSSLVRTAAHFRQGSAAATYHRHRRAPSGHNVPSYNPRRSLGVQDSINIPAAIDLPPHVLPRNLPDASPASTACSSPRRRIIRPEGQVLQLEPGRGTIISDKVVNRRGDLILIRPPSGS